MGKRFGVCIRLVVAVVMMLALAAPALAVECPPVEPPCPPPPCTTECRTPGYWKNHPDAWPVESITLGGVTYSKSAAIALLMQPDGDKSQTIFRALLAAKLNVLSGCSGIGSTIDAADAWLTSNPLGSGVKGSSDAWKCGEPLYWILDAWNNNLS